MIKWKHIALIAALLVPFVGAVLAFDARIDAKITLQLAPMKDDVRAIRGLLEGFLMTQIKGP